MRMKFEERIELEERCAGESYPQIEKLLTKKKRSKKRKATTTGSSPDYLWYLTDDYLQGIFEGRY